MIMFLVYYAIECIFALFAVDDEIDVMIERHFERVAFFPTQSSSNVVDC